MCIRDRYLGGLMTVGQISSFVLYSRKFSGPINEVANIMSELQSALAAAERVFGLMDESPEPEDEDVYKRQGVYIAKGAVVKDSIIMRESVIGANSTVNKAIIAENVKIGSGVELGVGEYAPSKYDPKVYQFDLVTIGENSIVPDNVKVGKNTAIVGETLVEDYPDGLLASGDYIIKAGGIR